MFPSEPRSRWRVAALAVLAVVLAAAVLVLCLAWWGPLSPIADPLRPAREAFAREDWELSADLAKRRLQDSPNDQPALRLLAYSYVKLGRDSSAFALFERLGPDAMTADDLYFMGEAFSRSGNRADAHKVWQEAIKKDENQPDALREISLIDLRAERYDRAETLSRRLLENPAWRARANALLGSIALARNDAEAAVAFWRQALDQVKDSSGAEGGDKTVVNRKAFARALLRARQPAEARRELQEILAKGPDEESSWLLSRAYLQEGALPEALAAFKAAGMFSDDDPTRPDPAPFVGSASCASCHAEKFQTQQRSRHARTFHRIASEADPGVPSAPLPDPVDPKVSHTFRREKEGRPLEIETKSGDRLYRAVIDYVYGSGDRGKTFVGQDDTGQRYEIRMSSYHEDTDHALWGVTSGHPPHPATDRDYLGLPLTSDAARLCFDCHVTNPQAVLTGKGPEALDPAIGCERCHGPGGNHSLAVAARFPDLAIGRPSAASGPQVVKICAQCHSPKGTKVEMSDPHSPRFAATTLTWSRCYTESKELLSCITCHDPHRDAVTTHAHYEAKCLACHPSGGQETAPPREKRRRFDLADAPRAHPCPVNPSTGCIDCHMPQVKNVVPHSTFTDHNIRIHEANPGEAAESGKPEETR